MLDVIKGNRRPTREGIRLSKLRMAFRETTEFFLMAVMALPVRQGRDGRYRAFVLGMTGRAIRLLVGIAGRLKLWQSRHLFVIEFEGPEG